MTSLIQLRKVKNVFWRFEVKSSRGTMLRGRIQKKINSLLELETVSITSARSKMLARPMHGGPGSSGTVSEPWKEVFFNWSISSNLRDEVAAFMKSFLWTDFERWCLVDWLNWTNPGSQTKRNRRMPARNKVSMRSRWHAEGPWKSIWITSAGLWRKVTHRRCSPRNGRNRW